MVAINADSKKRQTRASPSVHWLRVASVCAGICLSVISAAWCQSASPPCSSEPSVAGEDPRDAKLRELEARLADTEKKLSNPEKKQSRRPDKDLPPDDEDSGLVAATLAQQEQPRTDTERMELPGSLFSEIDQQPSQFRSDTGQFRTDTERMEAVPPPAINQTFPTHKITGFLQLDSAWYSQDPLNQAIVGNAQDGTGFRRARIAVLGKVAPLTLYQIEVDFATAGRPSFFDNYLEQEALPFFGAIRAGQYLQPFSVDAMSGFRNLPFLERSLPFLAFVPFRRVGVMASNNSEDERTYWAYSVFHTGGFNNAPMGDSQFATDIGNVGGYSFSGRLTQLIVCSDDDAQVWHIGGNYDFSSLGANNAAGSGTAGNAGGGPSPFYQAKT